MKTINKFIRLLPLVYIMLCLSACQRDYTRGETSISSASGSEEVSASLSSVDAVPSSAPSAVESTPVSAPPTIEAALPTEPTDDSNSPALVDELTLIVLTSDGKPVPNIGVYAYPSQGGFLASSASYATTDNTGIAVLQRVRTSKEISETVTIGLTDRNQSDAIQQTVTVDMPESASAYQPQAVVWSKTLPTDYLKKQTDKITLTIVNREKKTLPNIWVKISLPSHTAADGSNNDMGYQEDLLYEDRYLLTGSDGTCTFANVGKGTYRIDLWGGAPPFNLVTSENPLLQTKLIYSDKSTWGTTIDYTGGGEQTFTLEFIPYVP